MFGNNGNSVRHMFEHPVDTLKSGVHRVADRASAAREPARAYADKVTEMVKAHPLAAVGIAFGVGYVATRLARR